MDGVDDGASVFQWASASVLVSEFTACPTGVDEPTVDSVLGHALSEHSCVARWVEDEERCGVAGAEGWDGFHYAVFSSWSFPTTNSKHKSNETA